MNQEYTSVVLQKCRELMTERVNSSMTAMINEAQDKLNEMADKEKSLGKAVQYYDAIRLLRIKQQEILIRFEKRFVSIFQYRAENFLKFRNDTDVTLSKVGHSSFAKGNNIEEKKIINNSIINIKQDCKSVLLNIDRKMGVLIKDTEVNFADNPLQPETIFEAFWESCRDIRMRNHVRVLLVNLFEKYITLDAKNIYKDLDSQLETLASKHISDN